MESVIKEIINYEKKLFAKKDSAERLIHLIDDDFIEYNSNGTIHDKNEAARWLAQKNSYESQGTEFEAKFLSEDVILLTYILNIKQNNKSSRRISIWRKKNDTWKMVMHQGISIKSSS